MRSPTARTVLAGLLLAALLTLPPAWADGAPLWQTNSFSLLHGGDYAVDPARQQTLTFEHASGWNVGDLFLFVDLTRFDGEKNAAGDENTYYGEISPRLSLGKLFGREIAAGPVTDVLLAATYEFGDGEVETLLLGPGFDLALPGFDYFQLNVYRRIPQDGRDGRTIQITPVWAMTLPLGRSDILFDGFMDWNVTSDGGYERNLHFNPQLKYDLGKAMAWGDRRLYAGIEYSYWKNKYGIRSSKTFDSEQSAASLLLKLLF